MRTKFIILLGIGTAFPLHTMEPSPTKKKKKKNFVVRTAQSIGNLFAPQTVTPEIVLPEKIIVRPPEIVHFNHDCLSIITPYLCKNDQKLSATISAIKRFSRVNRDLYHYHQNDIIVKKISNILAVEYETSDLYMIEQLRALHIEEKFHDLVCKAEIQALFTTDDLSDSWYLNALFARPGKDLHFRFHTFLLVAILHKEQQQIQNLLKAGANPHHRRCQNPIALLANDVFQWFNVEWNEISDDFKREKYYSITKMLLEKNIDPDSRNTIMCPTLLHQAAYNGDEDFAYLLLSHGANPYKLYVRPLQFSNRKTKYVTNDISQLCLETDNRRRWEHNAFTLARGEPQDWLKKMYDQIQKEKKHKNVALLTSC